jgi:hypothetical protein
MSEFLRTQKTESAGTLKLNRKIMPSEVNEQKLKKGEPTAQLA